MRDFYAIIDGVLCARVVDADADSTVLIDGVLWGNVVDADADSTGLVPVSPQLLDE